MLTAAAKIIYVCDLKPVWSRLYPRARFPSELTIVQSADVNGGAFPDGAGGNIVEVTTGALHMAAHLVRFAIAHEMSHVATQDWLRREGLRKPDLRLADDCKWSEFAADLIAFHTLWCHQRAIAQQIANGFTGLQNELGRGDATHPSGLARVNSLRRYYNDVNQPTAIAVDVFHAQSKLVASKGFIMGLASV